MIDDEDDIIDCDCHEDDDCEHVGETLLEHDHRMYESEMRRCLRLGCGEWTP